MLFFYHFEMNHIINQKKEGLLFHESMLQYLLQRNSFKKAFGQFDFNKNEI